MKPPPMLVVVLGMWVSFVNAAFACGNIVNERSEEDVRHLANARMFLTDGDLQQARDAAEHAVTYAKNKQRHWLFHTRLHTPEAEAAAAVEEEARVILATVEIRLGASGRDLDDAIRILMQASTRDADDVVLRARLAEAMARTRSQSATAAATLLDLYRRDLLVEPEAYTVLSQLQSGELAKDITRACLRRWSTDRRCLPAGPGAS